MIDGPAMSAAVLDPAAILRLVDRHARFGAEHLLALGGFGSPIAEPCDRVGLLKIGAAAPRLREDVWVRAADRAALVAALAGRPGLRIGRWDALFADAWTFAWTEDRPDFILWDRRGRLAWVDPEALHTRRERIDRRSIAAIEATVSPAWDVHRVSARIAGEVAVIASKDNPFASIDPCYDGINLMVDAAWTWELGRPLAAALGVEFLDRSDGS